MYTLIDRSNMRFMATHTSQPCLSDLAHIELPHVAVAILPCDCPADFELFTDLELRLLVKHTTGAEHPNAYRASLLLTCAALANQLPERPLDRFELRLQASCIPMSDNIGRYRYAPGQHFPVKVADLFEPEPATCQQGWDEAKLKAFASYRPPLQAGAAPVTATLRSSPLSPASRPAAPASVPRGGTRATIWDCMDSIWRQAGKPTDLKKVLELRKSCMNDLESKYGVNRSTASSELGNWAKARVQPAVK
jgi:hypothetical protein